MTRMPPNAGRVDPRLDPIFVERERNRFAARALAFLVLLNGAAALVMLADFWPGRPRRRSSRNSPPRCCSSAGAPLPRS